MEQELRILPEHLSSSTFYWGSCCSIFSFLCSIVSTIVCLYFFLAIVLASDYNLDIFKVFLNQLTTIIDIFSKRYRHGRDRIV